MKTPARTIPEFPQPTFGELFTPKVVTVLREGYGLANLKADAIAGLTVAIVALPLSMAIAIAAGVSPAQGLYTAIVGGFLISAFGGSRFQIGGPAGAFIVLIAATLRAHGMDGLILATIVSGLILVAGGFLRLGTYIKFIPYPGTVGFTAGIAVIIFASQLTQLLSLTLSAREPGPLLDKIPVLWASLPTAKPATVVLVIATITIIAGLKMLRPRWPGLLIAVSVATLATTIIDLPVATIGSEFGGIPNTLPSPSLPAISMAKLQAVLPSAVAFALLGSIESLLSAVVADGMTGRRHRSNCELVGQGIANLASGLFGGMSVTGAIARTATNIRAGAHGPIAGMIHAILLLAFMLAMAPLASFIPLASLAGVLAVVAWNMIETQAIVTLVRASWADAAVLITTFLLTIFRDLTEAIVVGFALGSVLFIQRMSKTIAIKSHAPLLVRDDVADARGPDRTPYDESMGRDLKFVVYRISGAFFFGAAASIGSVLDRIADTHRALVIDFTSVPFLDSTAANTIDNLARKAGRKNVKVILTGTSHAMRQELFAHAIKPPLVGYERTIETALRKLRRQA